MKPVLPLKVVAPLVLGIIASLAITVYAELGYRRLEYANQQMALALEMLASLHETLALIVDAETGQRGYLLTGKVLGIVGAGNIGSRVGQLGAALDVHEKIGRASCRERV